MDSDIYVEITGERRGSDADSSEAKDDTIPITNEAFLTDQDNDMESVDQPGMLFWCQRCKEMRKAECPIHGEVKVVADTPRLTYAMSSLPNGLYRDPKGGVVSKKMYPVNTVFGPFISPRVMEIDNIIDREHPLPVTLADSVVGYLDIGDEEKCNWMMFVEPAQNWSEINLILYEVDEDLYFVCIKSLTYKGSQLRYSYAEPYAYKYGLTLLKREPSDFYCDACDLDFPSKMVKMRHLKSSKCMANQQTQNDLNTGEFMYNERKSSTKQNKEVKKVAKDKRSLIKIIKGKRKSALRKAQCGVCKLEFDNKELMNLHMASHEDEERLDDADITDQEGMSHCPEPTCEQSVDSITELYQHIVEAHSKPCTDNPEETPTAEETTSQSVNADLTMTDHSDSQTYHNELEIPKSAPPTCKVCFKVVTTVSQLAVHMKTHNNEDGSKFFKCFLCDERFKAPLYVRKHVVAVHAVNGKYTCPQCPHREYDSWEKCRKHVYSIHSGKEYPCLECGRVFSREDKLRIHALTHTNVKNHMCDICGRQFARKDKLLEHIRNVHKKGDSDASGIPLYQTKTNKFRPKVASSEYHRFIYKCLDCSLGFKRRGMLVNHLAKCHPSKEMSSVPELNLPILREQREYYCSHCSRSYKSSFKRKMHMIKCHPGSTVPSDGASQPVAKYTTLPFACDYCHKQYANKAKLKEHLRVAHPEHPSAVVERPPRTFIQTEHRLSEQSQLTTADLTHQDVVTLIQPVYPTTGEPVTISLQGINLGDGTRVDNNDLLTQALSANELQATFDFQQQCGGAVNHLGQAGGLELRVIQNPNLSIDLNSLQMAGLSNNSNITFTVPVSSLNPMTSLTNQIISSSNNLPSLDNNAVSQTNHRALFGNL